MVDLTPLIPLSYLGEGEIDFEGAMPLKTTPDGQRRGKGKKEELRPS